MCKGGRKLNQNLNTALQELLVRVVGRLVDYPDQVELSEKEGDTTLVFVVSTAKEDVGKLIGRQGANIGAVRTLISSAAGKHGKRAFVEIKEPERFGNV
jgi:predicted RNA-binding protein YlqC (UPF0109 family)